MYIEIIESLQGGVFNAKVYDGPDGIDSASLSASTLGELFQKIIVFSAFNGLTYSDDPRDTLAKYFQIVEER